MHEANWDAAGERLVEAINLARREDAADMDLETAAERRWHASCRLVVYGSLAPGASNHAVIQPVGGDWQRVQVHGELSDDGWGATHGYPGLRWRRDGPAVAGSMLVSDRLPQHWSRLDVFEGAQYQRILVPVFRAGAFVAVANVYAVGQQ